ncbi:hypothetical protein ACQP1P_25560 [Dactylosporangium sp. CA-052675]|uniref:hypothetical protein n=1 Tax=Dactylosporangium sp. CA-052675 TaxID=3239927 RepID=UPI003D9041F4
MVALVNRLADRMLARLVPAARAEADCAYHLSCWCSGGLHWCQKCMNGCPGVPNHCYAKYATGTC